MKLIHHALRHLLIPFFLIFTIWGTVFYFLIIHEINDETNDTLENYKELIIRSAIRDSSFLKNHDGLMTRYYIREIPKEEADVDKVRFFDTTTYIEIEMEYEPVRVLQTCFRMADDRYYELTIEMSTLEKDDMIETIATSMAIFYLLLILCVLIVSHWAYSSSAIGPSGKVRFPSTSCSTGWAGSGSDNRMSRSTTQPPCMSSRH